LLNALVFSQDIAVTRAFQAVKLQWWINNVNSYESQYPHRSHNKAFTDEFSKLGKSISQPSCLEWLKYVLLIKLFSPPKSSDNFFDGNNPNIFSTLVSKDNSKQNITLDNQNNDQDIHLVHPESVHLKDFFQNSSLDLSSNCLDPSTSSNSLNNEEPTNIVSENFTKIF
ncbi:12306_t:CDS:2, partial [Gigaspora margarita]